jgi:FkbM family methyltransferase
MTGAFAGAAGVGAVWSGTKWMSKKAPTSPKAPTPVLTREGRLSYSQMGEDLILYDLLHSLMKVDKPSYIDIGAADPVSVNNTYLLYQTGSRGVLVEPNPTYVERLRVVRPGDVVVGAGVGVSEATAADYYVIQGKPMLNTFSAEDVANRKRQSSDIVVEKVMKMPLFMVNHLIASHLGHAPDVLSIDVEGWDLAILQTLDFEKYRPLAIIAETGFNGTTSSIAQFLGSKGYTVCGETLYNTIFSDPKRYILSGA